MTVRAVPSRVARGALIVVMLALVSLTASACSAGQYVPPTTQLGFAPTTSVPAIPAVDQFAVDWSAGDGNPTPTTLVWGVCGPSTANFCNPGGHVAGTHLDVLEISGGSGFILGPGAEDPTARAPYLVVVIDSATWEVLEISYGGAENLSQSLSTPETDSLTGISPISPSAFHQRYRSHR
jgi:hypothetical protein